MLSITSGPIHPKRTVPGAAVTRNVGTINTTTMTDPARWPLVSEVATSKEMSTVVADIGATIETRPALASRIIGLGPRGIMTRHRIRYLMVHATCTFTSTPTEKGSLIIS